jgi:hypothetical protein
MTSRVASNAATVWLLLTAFSSVASAQESGNPADTVESQPAQGPMTVERVHDGFAIAPDFRFSELNGSSAWLAGAYGGWVIDNTILIGGGGYWLTNRSQDFDMAYGGAVVAWLQHTERTIGFGARALVGFGEATISSTLDNVDYYLDHDGHPTFFDNHPIRGVRPGNLQVVAPGTVHAIFHEHFFVTEPQADLLINFKPRLRLAVGIGYRLIGAADGLEHQLRGASGSVSLQIGGSSTERY